MFDAACRQRWHPPVNVSLLGQSLAQQHLRRSLQQETRQARRVRGCLLGTVTGHWRQHRACACLPACPLTHVRVPITSPLTADISSAMTLARPTSASFALPCLQGLAGECAPAGAGGAGWRQDAQDMACRQSSTRGSSAGPLLAAARSAGRGVGAPSVPHLSSKMLGDFRSQWMMRRACR